MQKNYLDNRINNFSFLYDNDLFLFDLDGTVYLDDQLLPGIYDLINWLKKNNKNFVFLTNNSSASINDYILKINKLGIDITIDNIYSSTLATINFLRQENIEYIYPLGTTSFSLELIGHGLSIDENEPQAVVVGFDKELTYNKLSRACAFISKGKKFIATHADMVCPTKNGYIPDCGSIIAALKAATGIEPKVLGKPNTDIVDQLAKKFNIFREKTVMIGDRLYTDIKMAVNSDINSVLVLTGESKLEDIDRQIYKPKYIIEDFSLYEYGA